MNKPAEFEDWCDSPEVIQTGDGWRVRINGCDVFDSVNQYGCKPHRSFDLVKQLPNKEAAEEFLREWLIKQLQTMGERKAGGADHG